MKFTKMHGAGNDYIYVNGFEETIPAPAQRAQLAELVSDRHFGIGGDGLVFILPSTVADFRMQMFNADGSEGKMCGNAIRCVGKYVYDNGMIGPLAVTGEGASAGASAGSSATARAAQKTEITVETLSGIKQISLIVEDGLVAAAKVNMGKPEFVAEKIPVIAEGQGQEKGQGKGQGQKVVAFPITVQGNNLPQRTFTVHCVSMGNPHAVIFLEADEDLTDELVLGYGPLIEKHAAFPDRINVEFVKFVDRGNLRMRVFERGSGETLACGTGASAVVVMAREKGMTEESVDVILLGGILRIDYGSDGFVYMTGPATKVFDGEI